MLFRKSRFLAILPPLEGSIAINPIQGPITGDVTQYEHTVSGTPSLTVVHADVVAPSGSTAVIDFTLSTPRKSTDMSTHWHIPTASTPCPSSPCPVTLVPHKFDPSIRTWTQHFETTFSVPTGSIPVIHFSPIQYDQGGTGKASSGSDRASSTATSSAAATGTEADTGSSGPTRGTTSSTAQTSPRPTKTPVTSGGNTSSSRRNTSPGVPSSSKSLTTKSTGTQSGTESSSSGTATGTNPNPLSNPTSQAHLSSGSTSGHSTDSTSTHQTTAQNTKSPSGHRTGSSTVPQTSNRSKTSSYLHSSKYPHSTYGHSSSNGHQSRTFTVSSDGTTSSLSSSTSDSTAATASGSTPDGTTSNQSTSTSDGMRTTASPKSSPSQQSTLSTSASLSLGESPDSEQMASMLSTMTGTSSAEVAELLSHWPTNTATIPWDSLDFEMSQIPTSTTTGAAVATEGILISSWFGKLNGNIQAADLKDPGTLNRVKDNLRKGEDIIDNYIKNREKNGKGGSGGSHTSDCSSKRGLFSIFKKISCYVKKAEDTIKGGSKDIGPIINEGLDLTKTGLSELKDNLPDVDDLKDDVEDQIKEQFEELTEGAEELEKLEKEEEKEDNKSSSSNESTSTGTSTSSSTKSSSSEIATCTSTTTVTDCELSTIFITSTVPASTGTGSPTVITSTTSTCSTKTGCDITATTETTTSYTDITRVCRRRTPMTTALSKSTGTSLETSSGTSMGASDSETNTITSGSRTITDTTLTTTTRASTSAPCEADSVQLASGWTTFCACSTAATGSGSVTSTITQPSGGKCGDYKAFPSTGFMNVATAYAELCAIHFGGDAGPSDKGGYCACQTSADGTATSQWIPLPHTQGSETALDCHLITSVSFTTPAPTTTTTVSTTFVSDATITDYGNGDIYVYPTGIVTPQSNYGGMENFTPAVETVGYGTATYEEVDNYETTGVGGLTTYWYAKATGDGNGDVTAVGTPTATVVAAPTQHCLRYVVPGPNSNGVYRSDEDEYIYAIYGIIGWDVTNAETLTGALKDCGVEYKYAEMDTGRWGTTVMWNNGHEYQNMTECVSDNFEGLGATMPMEGCDDKEWLGQARDYQGNPYKDSAPAEMDWIYKKWPKSISAPYPLST